MPTVVFRRRIVKEGRQVKVEMGGMEVEIRDYYRASSA